MSAGLSLTLRQYLTKRELRVDRPEWVFDSIERKDQTIRTLRAALNRYGGHEDDCRNPREFCTCGYTDAMKEGLPDD